MNLHQEIIIRHDIAYALIVLTLVGALACGRSYIRRRERWRKVMGIRRRKR